MLKSVLLKKERLEKSGVVIQKNDHERNTLSIKGPFQHTFIT